METAQAAVPVLGREDWALIRDLLENAHRTLPIEIRHTDSRAMREHLRHRLDAVERLLEQIQPLAGGAE